MHTDSTSTPTNRRRSFSEATFSSTTSSYWDDFDYISSTSSHSNTNNRGDTHREPHVDSHRQVETLWKALESLCYHSEPTLPNHIQLNPEFIRECREWTEYFPHLCVSGQKPNAWPVSKTNGQEETDRPRSPYFVANPGQIENSESTKLAIKGHALRPIDFGRGNNIEEGEEEEVFAKHGEYVEWFANDDSSKENNQDTNTSLTTTIRNDVLTSVFDEIWSEIMMALEPVGQSVLNEYLQAEIPTSSTRRGVAIDVAEDDSDDEDGEENDDEDFGYNNQPVGDLLSAMTIRPVELQKREWTRPVSARIVTKQPFPPPPSSPPRRLAALTRPSTALRPVSGRILPPIMHVQSIGLSSSPVSYSSTLPSSAKPVSARGIARRPPTRRIPSQQQSASQQQQSAFQQQLQSNQSFIQSKYK